MSKTSRRAFLMRGLVGSQIILVGCGGGGTSTADASVAQGQPLGTGSGTAAPSAPASPSSSPSPAQPLNWVLSTLALTPDTATSLDLRATLPAGVAPGGQFSVDPSGGPLPAGVQLAPSGLLTLTAGAQAGSTVGVIFAYAAP